MKYPVIVVPFLKVNGMALFPFILVKTPDDAKDQLLIRHESIHLKQEAELLIIPFYLIYLLSYLYNLSIYKNHDKAYYSIAFEREAYRHEHEENYLRERSFWAWRRYW